jgi:hypothetical protein
VFNAAGAGATSGAMTVTDALPAGLTPIQLTGTGWTCSLAPSTLPGSPNLFEPAPACTRSDTLAPGASFPPLTMDVAVADNTQPSVVNTVSVAGGGAVSATDGSAASGTDTTAIQQLPALAVTSFDTAGGVPYAPFTQGAGAKAADAYDITVANDGFAATSGKVKLIADLPGGLTAVSMSGAGWTCRLATTTCTLAGGPLAAGAQSRLVLTVAVAGDAPQSIPVTLQATGGGQIPAAGLDTNDLYGVISNGGAKVDQTYITPRG